MIGLESIRCSNIVVFGKARKLVGGEGSSRPREVLAKPLEPVDKPPHPLKLGEVLDWTVSYDQRDGAPSVWLVTLRAWYRLGNPAEAYVRVFAPMQRRVAFAALTANILRDEWNVECEDALARLADATPVAPGDLLEPKFRGAAAANAAARATRRTRRARRWRRSNTTAATS